MKKAIYFLVVTLIAIGIYFISCKSSPERIDNEIAESRQDSDSRVDYNEDINNFKKDINDRIDANEKRIKELRENLREEKKEVRKEYEEKIENLEQKNTALKKRINEYREDGIGDRWESFKQEFNHDMDELGNAIDNLVIDNKK